MTRNRVWGLLMIVIAFAMAATFAFSQVPLIGSTIDAKTGFKQNGVAPSGHYLCGNGTVFIDQATPCGGLFYQTVQAIGINQTQRPVLNFASRLTVTDSSSPARTNVDFTDSGVTPGTYTFPASVSVDEWGRVTAIAAGTGVFVPGTSGFEVLPSGRIHEWGHSTVINDGCTPSCTSVTYPFAFPHAAFAVTVADDFASVTSRTISVVSINSTTFTLNSNGGGNGAYWEADGW